MKTYRQIQDDLIDARVMSSFDYDDEDELMNESALRNVSAAMLVSKIRSLGNKVGTIRITKSMSDGDRVEAMLRQNKLLSQQNFYLSLLIAQLGIMKKENGR